MTQQNSEATAPETFRFGYGNTVLGTIVVAESDKGIVALFMGDNTAKLERDLHDAFPGVNFAHDPAGMAQIVAKAASLVNAPHLGSDLSPDLRGTALETAVWNALREIPSGETRTYGVIAKSLPMPTTAQEVGAACAANRIAVLVPCHRVVKSDGSISGYRWGVARKRKLINMEGVA